ncbi:MAG: type II toxin-antitoxin system HicB family antitoxin [Rhodothermales bacterium]
MNPLTYKDFVGTVDYDEEDRIFYGKLVDVNAHVLYHGATSDEVQAAFEEAVDDYLTYCQETGHTPRQSRSETVQLALTLDAHRRLADRAAAAGKSLSEFASDVLEAHVSR